MGDLRPPQPIHDQLTIRVDRSEERRQCRFSRAFCQSRCFGERAARPEAPP